MKGIESAAAPAAAVIGLLAALAAAAGLVLAHHEEERRHATGIAACESAIAGIHRLRAAVIDDTVAARGYALAGDRGFLVETPSDALDLAPIGDAASDHAGAALQAAARERMAASVRLRAAMAAGDAAGVAAAAAAGEAVLDRFRAASDAALAAAHAVRDRRRAASAASARGVRDALIAMFIGMGALLAAGGGLLVRAQWRQSRIGSRLDALIEASADLVAALDRDLRYTAFNTAQRAVVRQLTGREPRLGDSCLDGLPPASAVKTRALLDAALGGAAAVEVFQVGEDVHLEARATPIRDRRGAVVGAVSIARDISRQVRAERVLAEKTAELERSNADLEHFAYLASHDLQEPLRMVGSFTNLIASRYGDRLDADGREFAAFAIDGARRMQRLIDGLLRYARLGSAPVAPRPVDAEACLDLALSGLAAALRDAGATVERGPLPRVMADADQLAQVFQNLIANAVKHRGAAPPAIRISGTRDGALCAFAVADDGPGIAPEHHRRIFLLFQRVGGRTGQEGTGLGLAICKRIVERLGGTIDVASQPGAGATFRFTLPACPPEIA